MRIIAGNSAATPPQPSPERTAPVVQIQRNVVVTEPVQQELAEPPAPHRGGVRTVPWGLGRTIGAFQYADKYATTREAMQAAGLDWKVVKGQLFSTHGDEVIEVKDFKTVQRKDTGQVLGVVKGRYQPIQNRRLAEFNDVLVKASSGERAAVGTALGNRRVYCVTQLNDLPSPDGGLGTFLITYNAHDGTTALSTGVYNVRWACTNGQVSLSEKAHVFKIRHTVAAEERMKQARTIMAQVSEYLEDTTYLMNQMLAMPVGNAEGEAYIRHAIVPLPDTENERKIANAERKQDELLATWRNSDNLNDVRNTAWGLVQAVAEWNEWTGSHVNRRRRDPMERLLMGTDENYVAKARSLVLASVR